MKRFFVKNGPAYVFLTPWFIGFFLLAIGPILASLYLSFTNYNIVNPPEWTGLDNFEFMFAYDDRFRTSLRVTFTFVFLSVPLKLVFALAVAMLLDKGVRAIGIYRALFYLPSILGGSIAVAILWRQLFDYDGVINSILRIFGIEGEYWLSDPEYSLYTIIVLHMWQFGSPMLIFLAGLRAIPQELYEAAQIDAAGKVRRFFAITVPLLAPVIFFNLVLQMIDAFKAFTQAFVISGGNGAPYDSLLFITVLLYQEAFSYFRMGYASAMAWVLLAIIAVFTAIAFWSSKYWVHYESDRG
jgi:multiple sugar transport system permease protein